MHMTEHPAWYVVYTKPLDELMAASLLEERLQLEVYLPEVLQRYRQRMQLRPLFPRYLFVQTDLGQVEMSRINATPGVIQLVMFGDRPLPLKPGVIESIRAEVVEINQEGGLLPTTYRAGARVRLTEGPLRGLEAVFLRHLRASERAVVLLRFLGQENEIEVDLGELEPVAAFKSHRRRGTRGKGRRIHYDDDES